MVEANGSDLRSFPHVTEIPGDVLDECWERLVLGAIGEVLDPDDEITGVRLLHKVQSIASSECHALMPMPQSCG